MIKQYLVKEWRYEYDYGNTDKEFEDWVNSLSNLELIEYIDAALGESDD